MSGSSYQTASCSPSEAVVSWTSPSEKVTFGPAAVQSVLLGAGIVTAEAEGTSNSSIMANGVASSTTAIPGRSRRPKARWVWWRSLGPRNQTAALLLQL